MAYLFKVENNLVIPNTETLLINPFKEIWERDKSPKKIKAKAEFAYIEYMSSFKKSNPFREYADDKKSDAIIKIVFPEETWEPDEIVMEGIMFVDRLQQEGSTALNYYKSAKKAIEQLQGFLNNFDINERNFKTGNPVYKPVDITRAVNDTEKTLSNLNNLKKKVDEELFEESKNKANKDISPFATTGSL